MKSFRLLLLNLLLAWSLLFCSAKSWASGTLVIMGGGARPPDAIAEFVKAAGGPKSNLLTIDWGSEDPNTALDIASELFRSGSEAIIAPSSHNEALPLIQKSSGIFFTGGDQNRLMGSFARALRQAVVDQYTNGASIAGTSAGAA